MWTAHESKGLSSDQISLKSGSIALAVYRMGPWNRDSVSDNLV